MGDTFLAFEKNALIELAQESSPGNRENWKGLMKKLIVCSSLLLAICSFSPKPASAAGDQIPQHEVSEQRRRMDALVAEITKETWEQSVESLLTDPEQFAYYTEHPKENDLEKVLRSWRAVKVLNTLQAMPAGKRNQTCRELFDRALLAYEDACYFNIQYSVNRFSNRTERVNTFSNKTDKARERPRYGPMPAVCLALIATAEAGRRDLLAEQFARVDEFQTSVKIRLEQARNVYPDNERELLLEDCVPDPRFQLNVIRLAALRDPKGGDALKRVDEYCRSLNLTTNQLRIVAWNARTTLFESRVGSGPDMSKGVTTYSFYDWGQAVNAHTRKYSQRREIVQKARELAL